MSKVAAGQNLNFQASASTSQPISIYFHIPFCTKKCDYCHFYVLPNKEPFHALLMEGLLLDIEKWRTELVGKEVVSIYFGGGTPALLGAAPLFRLLETLRAIVPFKNDDIEITLEANPETISLELMREYAEAGVNRVSIGVQSLDDVLLKKLGRTHHASAAIEAVETTAVAGISNISVDLMYDIPLQTISSWKNTLKQAIKLPITHLSLYNLTIEPQTVFFKYKEKLRKELPDADSSSQMYMQAIEHFESGGLKQYEISAFAKNDLYSRHNVGYWTGRPFLGFGPSAFSYWKGKRFRAVAHLQKYLDALRSGVAPIDFSEELPPDKHRRELLAISMRLCEGVNLNSFENEHGQLDLGVHESISKLIAGNLLINDNGTLQLTKQGILFYDDVAVEII